MTTITYIHLPRVNGSIQLEYPKTYHTYIHIHTLWPTSQQTYSASDHNYLHTSCTTSQRQHTYTQYIHTYTPAHDSAKITAPVTIITYLHLPQPVSASTELGYSTYHTYKHVQTLQPTSQPASSASNELLPTYTLHNGSAPAYNWDSLKPTFIAPTSSRSWTDLLRQSYSFTNM